MKVVELRAELKRRGLDTAGLKAVLVARLLEDEVRAGRAVEEEVAAEEEEDIVEAAAEVTSSSEESSDEDDGDNTSSGDDDDGMIEEDAALDAKSEKDVRSTAEQPSTATVVSSYGHPSGDGSKLYYPYHTLGLITSRHRFHLQNHGASSDTAFATVPLGDRFHVYRCGEGLRCVMVGEGLPRSDGGGGVLARVARVWAVVRAERRRSCRT